MIIYKAYLEYGPYDGESELGYFESLKGATDAVFESAKEYAYQLDEPTTSKRHTYYRVQCDYDYNYVIEMIELKP